MKLKSALIGSAAAAAICVAAPAQAEYYISVFGGMSMPDADNLEIGPFSYSSVLVTGDNVGSVSFSSISFTGTDHRVRAFSGTRYWDNHSSSILHTRVNAFNEDEFDTGFVIGAAFGHELSNGWRAELELAWRNNGMGEGRDISGAHSLIGYSTGISSVVGNLLFYPGTATSGSSKASGKAIYTSGDPYTWYHSTVTGIVSPVTAKAESHGDISTFSLMANLWGDFDLGDDNPMTPFIGIGVGAANIAVDYGGEIILPANPLAYSSLTSKTFQTTARFESDTSGWTWAWQAGAGLAFDLGGGKSLSAQYRYFATGEIEVLGQDFGISSHEVLVGLRIPLGRQAGASQTRLYFFKTDLD